MQRHRRLRLLFLFFWGCVGAIGHVAVAVAVAVGCFWVLCTPAVHDEILVCVPHFYRHPVCAYILRRYVDECMYSNR